MGCHDVGCDASVKEREGEGEGFDSYSCCVLKKKVKDDVQGETPIYVYFT